MYHYQCLVLLEQVTGKKGQTTKFRYIPKYQNYMFIGYILAKNTKMALNTALSLYATRGLKRLK